MEWLMSPSSCIVCVLYSDSCHRMVIHGRIELRHFSSIPCIYCKKFAEIHHILCDFSILGCVIRRFLCIFAPAIRKERKDILLDSHTITTVEIRANLHIGTVPFTGADFPYLKVVCGEPCDVWRESAPFIMVMNI